MKPHRLLALVAALLSAHLVLGCDTFGKDKTLLPEGRNVKVVEFPVRHLRHSDTTCRQEFKNVELSGTVTNLSPYRLTNVRINVITFFAGDIKAEKITILTTPSSLLPSDSATFEMTSIVEDPVARIELHAAWDEVK